MDIGPIHIDGAGGRAFALAPMDDVTDMPFRLLCKELGADLVYTEFIQSRLLVHSARRVERRLVFDPRERPIGVQLYGSDEGDLREAARLAEAAGPDLIDINCGCWVKKIAGRGDGAGLLRDLGKFGAVVRAVAESTALPVTVKTRLGWDDENIVILDAARVAEDNGARALTVHCRTRNQGYSGRADWTWLERIRKRISIPLIGNGDLETPEDFGRMFATGCDGAMAGRGAIHHPWLFARAKEYMRTGVVPPEPSPRERAEMCMRHLGVVSAYRGEQVAVPQFRKHYKGYLGDLPGFAELRADLMTLIDLDAVLGRLARFRDTLPATG
jgi:tRNA-dihydrouridine synthase B